MATVTSPDYMKESRGYTLTVVASVLIVAMVTAVGARMLARRLKNLPLHLDDFMILPALLLAVVLCLISIAAVQTVGLGRHIEAAVLIEPDVVAVGKRLNFVYHVVAYSGVIVLAKVSVLVFYNRVFKERWVRHASYLVGGIVVALGIAVFVSPFVACRPMNWIFTGHTTDGHCIDWPWYFTFLSVPNILTDVALLVIPLPNVWRLTMSFWQKMGLTFAFTLGGLNVVASCIRFYVFCGWSSHLTEDITWQAVDPVTWVMVESGTLVIAACMPHLRPLVSRLVPKAPPRDQAHAASTTAEGLFKPLRHLARKLGGDKHDARGWWMLSFMQRSRTVVAKDWEPWHGHQPATRSEDSHERRTERWLDDLEQGLSKERPWPPLDGIVMTEEIVIVVTEERNSAHDEKT